MTPPAVALLTLSQAACAARALAAYPRTAPRAPWPEDPTALYLAAQEAALELDDIALALCASPLPPARESLAVLLGKHFQVCPPRTHALDPITGRPKVDTVPCKKKRPAYARRDPRVITYVQRPNPRRPGTYSYDMYEHYVVGASLDELVAGGVVRRVDVRWDLRRGHIRAELPK